MVTAYPSPYGLLALLSVCVLSLILYDKRHVSSCSADAEGVHFTRGMSTNSAAKTTLTRSKLACAALCAQENCHVFDFDKRSQICTIGAGVYAINGC